ncbi:Na+/H+ antiporter subunit E [Chengkuizengella axinellae]|uniref:Na+/H+ antiporter subunit E n=1 Tax=Chengkuizengella axinellae TaxID=3064388 RepID=A0ABT9ITS1_9BACL|nr:Na+/H+ antiporter subunit E [Chengkuizengella sp. 2205SS18-9]MDP5272754.1 Na+/H+ antiporter subunit E [Chengkuizengella sp. 2205SS18-9]
MQLQILMNITIAFIWMFFYNSWNLGTFFNGYIIGLGLLFALRRFIPGPFYFKKIVAIVKLIFLFLKELVLSSVFVAKEVLRPKLRMRPGIIAVPTCLKSDWEITIFACLITLTPGTLTLEVSPEGDVLYIHSMDVPDTEEFIDQIKNTFEKAIMEVSR